MKGDDRVIAHPMSGWERRTMCDTHSPRIENTVINTAVWEAADSQEDES